MPRTKPRERSRRVQGLTDSGAENTGKLSVLMPVYNEARTVRRVLRRVLALRPLLREIIVVDDGSTDDTARIVAHVAFREPLVRFFQLERNQGKTAAVRHALAQAEGDILIIQDADLEYDPADIPDVIAPILKGQADVVYGSRFLRPQTARVLSRCHYLANAALTWFSNLFTGRRMTDVETCYKAFRAGVLKPLTLTSKGFGMEVEITALVSKTRARIDEVPISYQGRSYAEGKKIGLKDGVMAGLYILYYNLVKPWSAAGRRYVREVNHCLSAQHPCHSETGAQG